MEAVNTAIESIKLFLETSFEVVRTGYDVAYTFVWGLLVMLWNTLERFAEFLGASVHFVVSNIVILILLLIGFVFYRTRSKASSRKVTFKGNSEKL